MARKAVILVEFCGDCPHCIGGSLGTPTICELTKTIFVNSNGHPTENYTEGIANDCPLEVVND